MTRQSPVSSSHAMYTNGLTHLTVTDETLVVTNGVNPRVEKFPVLIQLLQKGTEGVRMLWADSMQGRAKGK